MRGLSLCAWFDSTLQDRLVREGLYDLSPWNKDMKMQTLALYEQFERLSLKTLLGSEGLDCFDARDRVGIRILGHSR